jgi:hypothetical protein
MQPFGGARGGTNDKAGSMQNLLRWTRQEPSKKLLLRHRLQIPILGIISSLKFESRKS